MKKTFVLRLNSLLSSVDSTLRFGPDNEIVIPMAVIDQLQSYQGKPEKKKIASKILEYLETFDIKLMCSQQGVMQQNGSTLRIVQNYHAIEVKMNDISEADKRIFQVCLGLMHDNQQQKVILVSKNPVTRIKARTLGITAEDFKDDLFPLSKDQYSGRAEVNVFKSDIDAFYNDKSLSITKVIESEKIQWTHNMFVIMRSVDSNQSALARYDGNKLVPLRFNAENYPYKITAKNVGQKMLMECLMQDSKTAPLVIAKGSAGTGKTYCSLAVALKGIDDEVYKKILVATPSETVGNERLGFLPSDIVSKVSPYLGGIKDNLAILLNSNEKKSNHGEMTENGEYYFEKGLIEIQPIGFLRGRTIVNSIFIIDETQNIDPGDIKSIVTRAAEGSKFIFLGDPTQVDNPKLNERYNGLVYLSEKMKGNPLCWQITLESDESVRSELSTIASRIL